MKNVVKYIPNTLTIIRFIFIPFIVVALALSNYKLGLILFIISSLTDVADGFIARKFNAISDFGKLMDPLADKLTQLSVILTLTIKEIVPTWIIVVLLLKEITMISGASFLYGKDLVVSSKWYGKLTTVLLFTAVVSSLITRMFNLPAFDVYIYYLAIAFAVFSLFSYIHYFYGKGYLPQKEELKETLKVKEKKKESKKNK